MSPTLIYTKTQMLWNVKKKYKTVLRDFQSPTFILFFKKYNYYICLNKSNIINQLHLFTKITTLNQFFLHYFSPVVLVLKHLKYYSEHNSVLNNKPIFKNQSTRLSSNRLLQLL